MRSHFCSMKIAEDVRKYAAEQGISEDEALEKYLETSKAMDRSTARLIALVPRGWLVLGLLGLAPAFLYGDASPARVAIAVGGTLLAYRAWRRLTAGAWQLAGAAVASVTAATRSRARRPSADSSASSSPVRSSACRRTRRKNHPGTS